MTSVLAGDALLGAWELGSEQQGETLLATLLAAAFDPPDVPWLELPLGTRDAALLSVYEPAGTGIIETVATCPSCATVVDVSVDAAALAAPYGPPGDAWSRRGPDRGWFEVTLGAGPDRRTVQARQPAAADLIAAAGATDVAEARTVLVERCTRQSDGILAEPEALDAIATELDRRDPLADVRIDVVCGECGDRWPTRLDVAALVWAQVRRRAHALLVEIDALAQRYGWSEAEILSLPARRRRTYLDLG
jgi:hypothetical protein